jgi:hypothetical protein
MTGSAYASGVADLPLSSCPDGGGSPAVSCDAAWVVPLSPADILTLQHAPAGAGSRIDWEQP